MIVFEQNVVSAIAIGLIIAVMAYIKNSHLKALVYSLPIPITIALIATGGRVNVTNIIGLFLLNIFLWLVWLLYERGVSIFISDIIAALSYVAVGYFAINHIKVSFFFGAFVYIAAWIGFVLLYRQRVPSEKNKQNPKINPCVKGLIVTVLAYILLGLKSYLSGIIVTFPFSGVFAVIESKHILETLASVFSRNSIAILSMFITIYSLGKVNLGVKIIIGWIAYLIVLKLIMKYIPLSKSV